MQYAGIEITWLGHDGFRLSHGGLIIYIDPFQIRGGPPADLLLITHEHFDHLSPEDIKKIAKQDTQGVAPQIAADGLRRAGVRSVRVVGPGDVIEVRGVKIEAYPAYNVNKFRSPGKPFHPKEENRVGYVLEIAGTRIYHAGDTDHIPEMQKIRADLALLPVSGVYVMTADEAASAVGTIRPKAAVPMHWGSIVGSEADARRFEALVKGQAQVFLLPREA